MNEFINANYMIIFTSESVGADWSQADEIILTEMHAPSGYRDLNSLFINTFSTEKDTILVEAFPSLQEISCTQSDQAVWLNTEAKIMGWDVGTLGTILKHERFQQVYEKGVYIELLQKNYHEITTDANIEIEFSQKCSIPPEDLHRMACSSNDHKKAKIYAELVELYKPNLIETFKMLGEIDLCKPIIDSFPSRTKSMISSMRQVKEQRENSQIENEPSRTFLITGVAHAYNESLDPRFSLISLHQFLKQRNAIILKPKKEVVDRIGKKHTAFVNEIAQAAGKDPEIQLKLIQINRDIEESLTAEKLRNMEIVKKLEAYNNL